MFQELCSSRAKMDLKAIAKEITDEAERKPRWRQKQTENLLAIQIILFLILWMF